MHRALVRRGTGVEPLPLPPTTGPSGARGAERGPYAWFSKPASAGSPRLHAFGRSSDHDLTDRARRPRRRGAVEQAEPRRGHAVRVGDRPAHDLVPATHPSTVRAAADPRPRSAALIPEQAAQRPGSRPHRRPSGRCRRLGDRLADAWTSTIVGVDVRGAPQRSREGERVAAVTVGADQLG